jgi:glucose-6-phosphate 1-epimerase
MVTLYEYTNQPRYWIAHDEDGYWLVPGCDNGWSERIPFIGHVIALRQVTDLDGIDLGIPDDHH